MFSGLGLWVGVASIVIKVLRFSTKFITVKIILMLIWAIQSICYNRAKKQQYLYSFKNTTTCPHSHIFTYNKWWISVINQCLIISLCFSFHFLSRIKRSILFKGPLNRTKIMTNAQYAMLIWLLIILNNTFIYIASISLLF